MKEGLGMNKGACEGSGTEPIGKLRVDPACAAWKTGACRVCGRVGRTTMAGVLLKHVPFKPPLPRWSRK